MVCIICTSMAWIFSCAVDLCTSRVWSQIRHVSMSLCTIENSNLTAWEATPTARFTLQLLPVIKDGKWILESKRTQWSFAVVTLWWTNISLESHWEDSPSITTFNSYITTWPEGSWEHHPVSSGCSRSPKKKASPRSRRLCRTECWPWRPIFGTSQRSPKTMYRPTMFTGKTH